MASAQESPCAAGSERGKQKALISTRKKKNSEFLE